MILDIILISYALTPVRAFAATTCHATQRVHRHSLLNILTVCKPMGPSLHSWLCLLASNHMEPSTSDRSSRITYQSRFLKVLLGLSWRKSRSKLEFPSLLQQSMLLVMINEHLWNIWWEEICSILAEFVSKPCCWKVQNWGWCLSLIICFKSTKIFRPLH